MIILAGAWGTMRRTTEDAGTPMRRQTTAAVRRNGAGLH